MKGKGIGPQAGSGALAVVLRGGRRAGEDGQSLRSRAPSGAVPSAGYVISHRSGLAVARPRLFSLQQGPGEPRGGAWAFPEPVPAQSRAGRRRRLWIGGARPHPLLRAVVARRRAARFPLSRAVVLPGQASAREGVSPLFLWLLCLQAGLSCSRSECLTAF